MNRRSIKILSGGQTGVDRAALDAAQASGMHCGGWCPRGRKAEDGRISLKYPLLETQSETYETRTRKNVEESDGTFIISRRPLTGGTLLTKKCARKLSRPYLVYDLVDPMLFDFGQMFADWLQSHRIRTLNVAGPRESTSPGIYTQAYEVLRELFRSM